jgi:hypothetical protein
MNDHDTIAQSVRHRHLCLGCIAAASALDRFYVDAVLIDLARLNRVGSSPGRCRDCRALDIVFYARAL